MNVIKVTVPGVVHELESEVPLWLKGAALARSHFVLAVLVFDLLGDNEASFLVLYALQNPYRLIVQRVERLPPRDTTGSCPSDYLPTTHIDENMFEFKMVVPRVYRDLRSWRNDEPPLVLPHCTFSTRTTVLAT